ncbi:hypothetical protein DRN50_08955 [Thermococci archaeon]|nr:MAG: hypothetical protein DRN50_08955 [Thermococci archaeon]
MPKSKALIGLRSICDYLQVSRKVFYDLVDKGLPVKRLGNRWVSHTEVLDKYFEKAVEVEKET